MGSENGLENICVYLVVSDGKAINFFSPSRMSDGWSKIKCINLHYSSASELA